MRKMGFSQKVVAEWETMEDRLIDLEEELEDLKIEYKELEIQHSRLQEEFNERLMEIQNHRSWEYSTRRW